LAATCCKIATNSAKPNSLTFRPHNRFPDTGEEPEYNTVDTALWYFQVIRACHSLGSIVQACTTFVKSLPPILSNPKMRCRIDMMFDRCALFAPVAGTARKSVSADVKSDAFLRCSYAPRSRLSLHQPAGNILVKDTAYQRLIRHTFRQSFLLQFDENSFRNTDVHPFVFSEGSFYIGLVLISL